MKFVQIETLVKSTHMTSLEIEFLESREIVCTLRAASKSGDVDNLTPDKSAFRRGDKRQK